MVSTTEDDSAIVAPSVRALDVLASQLESWLMPRLAHLLGAFRVTGLQYPQGAGQSHETILFDVGWEEAGAPRSTGYVVRIKPTSFRVFNEDLFLEEYKVMRVLSEMGGIPIATPLWFEQDAGLLGAPFFVLEKRIGRVPVSIPSYMERGWVVDEPIRRRTKLWEKGVRALASLADVPVQQIEFLSCPRDGRSGFEQEWNRWRRFHERISSELDLPEHRRMWDELERARPAVEDSGLTWGDARLGNLMFNADLDVVAIMDWEQPSLGGPLQDLGWWLFNDRMKIAARGGRVLPGLGDRAETVALWREATGRETPDLDWYEAFAGYKMVLLTINMMRMRGERPPGGDFLNVWNAGEVRRLLAAF